MDRESKDILNNLIFLHGLFATFFVAFVMVFTIIGVKFVNNTSAFYACQGVDDSKFTACYEEKR